MINDKRSSPAWYKWTYDTPSLPEHSESQRQRSTEPDQYPIRRERGHKQPFPHEHQANSERGAARSAEHGRPDAVLGRHDARDEADDEDDDGDREDDEVGDVALAHGVDDGRPDCAQNV